MPIPASINDLSQTAGSNSPAGSESPSLIDDYLRTHASYIALLRDTKVAVNEAAPPIIASAATTNIGAATTNVVFISGTTTITSLGTMAAGTRRTVIFPGSLLLTYNAVSLVLPTGANILTSPGDSAEFLSTGPGNWVCLGYSRASGKPAAFAYDRSNILGTVSQSAGVPTAAIIERSSNVNGQYVKFADGTMYCALPNQGSIYFNASNLGLSWSYPQTFAAIEWVMVNALTTLGVSKQITTTSAIARTTTSATIAVCSVGAFVPADAASVTLDMVAFGRWF